MTIEIRDEELIAQLNRIAQRENRPIESVLKSLVSQYPTPTPINTSDTQPVEDDDYRERQNPQVRDIYLRAYEEARTYWRSVGDTEKANLTDEQMDREFWSFDEDGIPRLKDERPAHKRMSDLELALMRIQSEGSIIGGNSIDPEKIDDILNEEFADYLIQRMNRGIDE